MKRLSTKKTGDRALAAARRCGCSDNTIDLAAPKKCAVNYVMHQRKHLVFRQSI
jgi:hypothetical protein